MYVMELEDMSVRALHDGIRYAQERADREQVACAVWMTPSGTVYVLLADEPAPFPSADKIKVVQPRREA